LNEWVKGKRNTTGGNKYEAWPAYDVSDPVNWFALLNEGLKHNPPRGDDLIMLGLFEPLGIGPDQNFARKKGIPHTQLMATWLHERIEQEKEIAPN